MIPAGQRNRLVSFERGTAVADEYGGETPVTWSALTAAYARVKYGTGQERREAAQERAQQAITIECNWTAALASAVPTDRLQVLGGIWDITSVAPIGLNDEIHFTAVREA